MAVTLKDLAAMSGCSIRTVNRVIWRSGPVAEAKRLRIEALLREHHYVPNMAARPAANVGSGDNINGKTEKDGRRRKTTPRLRPFFFYSTVTLFARFRG